MTVKDLINELQKFDENSKVAIGSEHALYFLNGGDADISFKALTTTAIWPDTKKSESLKVVLMQIEKCY